MAINMNNEGVFLDGFDVVAYFNANEATRGTSAHSARYKDATFYFSSEANKRAFEANAASFMPKYGGFCAFAVANGKAGVPANPGTFKLRDGELLMFYDGPYEGKRFNTIVPWNADERSLYAKAEANWPKLGG